MNTYCFDTNYFLRFLVRDNEEQFQIVSKLLYLANEYKCTITSPYLVFFEVNWVLHFVYGTDRESIIVKLRGLLSLSNVRFDDHELLQEALLLFEQATISLEDCFIILSAKKTSSTFSSFDQKANRIARAVQKES